MPKNKSTSSISPVLNDSVVNEDCIPTDRTIFFNNWTRSTGPPSAAQVREASTRRNLLLKRPATGRGQHVVAFPELNLVVKYGHMTTTPISEGQTLWFLSHIPSILVPKVYGWCEDGDERFIYMEHIKGVTIQERWPSLSNSEKLAVVEQLNSMVSSMRRLKQALGNEYIGALCHGHIYEQVWNGLDHPLGPFDSVKLFIDALLALGSGLPGYPDDPFFDILRSGFPDKASVKFTHTDLNPCNIMMSSNTTDVLAIVDWQETGWYPEFWEYIKAFWTVTSDSEDDWKDHIGMITSAYDDALVAFDQFNATGCLV